MSDRNGPPLHTDAVYAHFGAPSVGVPTELAEVASYLLLVDIESDGTVVFLEFDTDGSPLRPVGLAGAPGADPETRGIQEVRVPLERVLALVDRRIWQDVYTVIPRMSPLRLEVLP